MDTHIPILKLGDILLVSIQVDLCDRLALSLKEQLTAAIVRHRAKGVLIEISALEIVDSFMGRVLTSIAKNAALLNAETILVGMRPAVAITLVEFGVNLKGVRTALNPEAALEMLATPSKQYGAQLHGNSFQRAIARSY